MTNIVCRTLSIHKEHEVLLKLETAGLDDQLAQKIIDSKDNDLAGKVIRLIRNGGFEPSTNQKYAREIMGKNFFGVEEAIQYFGVNPSRNQIAALSEIPITAAELADVKDTHVLVAVFPLSILEIRSKIPADRRLFYDQDWYNKQAFAKDRGEVEWKLIRKTPVQNSTSKNWQEQQALLSPKDETPTSRVMVYTIIGHFLATDERLFEKIYVRCSDVASDGDHVDVGNFDAGGLVVGNGWDDGRFDRLGLASARKSE